MVHAVTGMTPDDILFDLPSAWGLQYRGVWLIMQGKAVRKSGAFADAL